MDAFDNGSGSVGDTFYLSAVEQARESWNSRLGPTALLLRFFSENGHSVWPVSILESVVLRWLRTFAEPTSPDIQPRLSVSTICWFIDSHKSKHHAALLLGITGHSVDSKKGLSNFQHASNYRHRCGLCI